MANTNRFSSYTSVSAGSGNNAAGSVSASAAGGGGDGAGGSGSGGRQQKKDLWNSMLDSVASGRKLPERNLLVLGGSVDSQREFLTSLGNHKQASLNGEAQLPGGAPVANNFALGYTYYDVLDADQDGDILARISLYLLSKPSPSFSSLLRPLLTPETIPNTLIVILLDWAQPWRWLRQLREWILLLRTVLVSLSPAAKEALEETMEQWRERGRGGARNLDGTTTAGTGGGKESLGGVSGDGGDALPPGPGEWEDALGLPLCVVCQNAEKTDVLEKTQGWKDDEFDLVLQYLRTVLVKHGASLIYTTPNVPSQLPTLIHACLGVTSLLKRQPLKPEVIKRNEVVVPSNWDSWTKILVVREGFEVDKVSAGWSIDLQRPFPVVQVQAQAQTTTKNESPQISRTTSPPLDGEHSNGGEQETFEGQGEGEVGVTAKKNNSSSNNNNDPQSLGDDDYDDDDDEDPDSAVSQYERAIRDPGMDVLALAGGDLDEEDEEGEDDEEEGEQNNGTQKRRRRRRRRQQLEVETEDVQLFLGDQLKLLDQLRQKDEAKRDKEAKESKRRESSTGGGSGSNAAAANGEDPAEVISSHIGPVQFNIGGIQVDADDMLERIKNRHGYGSASPEPGSPDGASVGAGVAGGSAAGGAGIGNGPDSAPLAPENVDTEKMTAFFADLMNRPSQTRKS